MVERIRNLREDRDFTQERVARLLNVSQATYSDYENEKINIPIAALIQLAVFYDTSIDYLTGLTDDPQPYPRVRRYPTSR